MAQHWDQAVESYRTLAGFYPDNVDYGLGLASVLTKAGRAPEALATIAALRSLPAPASEDVRIDLAEAEVSHQTSNYPRELAAGQVAADRGLQQGARLLVAQGRLAQAQGHLRLGHAAEAARFAESARQLFIAGGDRNGEARALNRIANIAYEQGDYAQAKRLFEEAANALRSVGNSRDLTSALNNIADTMMMQDELSSARPIFDEALQIARDRADVQLEGLLRLNLGDLAYRLGDLTLAQTLCTRGVELARTSGYTYAEYMGLLALGNVALARGDLAEAAKILDQGEQLARRAGDRRYTAYIVAALGEVALVDSHPEIARRRNEEALEIRLALGGQTEVAESRLALARVAIAERKSTGASADVQSAIETFQARQLAASEAYGWAVRSASALSANRATDAPAVDAAERLLPRVQTISRRLWITIQIARARAGQGRLAQARASLDAVAAQARQRRFVWLEREARQALNDLR
jgi:tetratricopeptide (TPR) repeat protein